MKCGKCGSQQLAVINSRQSERTGHIWRRRRCLICKFTFTTQEHLDLSNIWVTKKNGKPEKYDHIKLYLGVYRSANEAKGINKKSSRELASRIVSEVEKELVARQVQRIDSHELGSIVLKVSKKISFEVFFRFAAYFEVEKIKEAITEWVKN
jgi:transcriptional repressor NrdR